MDYQIHLNRLSGSGRGYGRHVEHDERSRAYAVAADPAKIAPVRWTSSIPILDQGNLGACTGFAAVGCLGHHPFIDTLSNTTLTNDTGRDVYHRATTLDSISGTWPPTDTGSTGLAAAKALKALGWISGYQHSFSLDSVKTALQSGPVIMGTNWYNSMFDPDGSGVVTVNQYSGIAGGHEYICDEYRDDGYFGFTNSWSDTWGANGRFYMTEASVKLLLAQQGDVVLFTPNNVPAPTPQPIPTPPPAVPDADVVAAFHSLQAWATRNDVA